MISTIQPALEETNRRRREAYLAFRNNSKVQKQKINPTTRDLINSLNAIGRIKKKGNFLFHIAGLAYEDKQVALAVLDKIVPDQKLIENEGQNDMRPVVNIINAYGNPNTNSGVQSDKICIRDLGSSSPVQADLLAQTGQENNTRAE